MIFTFVRFITLTMVVLLLMTSSVYANSATCTGRFFNPISEMNWDMIFPIRIMGVKINMHHSSTDSPETVTSPICLCPSHFFGIPTIGIMVTYHEPLYMEEIVKTPGCLSSLGGEQVLHGFSMEQTNLQEAKVSSSRWQIHWYEYPVFSVLEAFKDFICLDTSGFALAYMTEIDPTWQNDAWSAIFSPQAILFANPLAQSACAIDAVSATASHPLDTLFWCAGSWGSVYPLSGTANASVGRIQSANLVGAKMIARLSSLGMLWDTVGHAAKCTSYPMPIWMKSEFSIDPVYPEVAHGNGMNIGAAPAVWQYIPPQTVPYEENINQVVFQEQQCCIRA